MTAPALNNLYLRIMRHLQLLTSEKPKLKVLLQEYKTVSIRCLNPKPPSPFPRSPDVIPSPKHCRFLSLNTEQFARLWTAEKLHWSPSCSPAETQGIPTFAVLHGYLGRVKNTTYNANITNFDTVTYIPDTWDYNMTWNIQTSPTPLVRTFSKSIC